MIEMTKEKFDKTQRAIIIPVDVEADGIMSDFQFIVDTGSQETLISEKAMRQLGYTRVDSLIDVPIQTVDGSATAYRYQIESITALGLTRRNVNVISHEMPPGSGVDGLLGFDFFEDTKLIIDFKTAEISVVM